MLYWETMAGQHNHPHWLYAGDLPSQAVSHPSMKEKNMSRPKKMGCPLRMCESCLCERDSSA